MQVSMISVIVGVAESFVAVVAVKFALGEWGAADVAVAPEGGLSGQEQGGLGIQAEARTLQGHVALDFVLIEAILAFEAKLTIERT